MKELVGRIYRDENGVETIESNNQPISEWKITPFDESNRSNSELHYGYEICCPYCGNSKRLWQSTYAAREFSMELAKYSVTNTYCGCCGHRNIH